jgi:AraC-like DNA-binding protein
MMVSSSLFSTILSFDSSGEKVGVEYMLSKGERSAAGVWIRFDELKNFSGYDYVRLKIKDSGSISILMELFNYDERVTKREQGITYVVMTRDLMIAETEKDYILPFKEFQIGDWWYMYNNIHDNFPSFYNCSRIYAFQIISGMYSPVNRKAGFTISGLSFGQDHPLLFLRVFAGLVLYWAVAVSVYLWMRRKKAPALTFPHEKSELPGRAESERHKIIQYLAESYRKPDLSQVKMANDLGIHPARIGGIVKNFSRVNFKQYLNLVRISEARRLLSSTDLDISEIAYVVGYSNVTHFDRIFRSVVE